MSLNIITVTLNMGKHSLSLFSLFLSPPSLSLSLLPLSLSWHRPQQLRGPALDALQIAQWGPARLLLFQPDMRPSNSSLSSCCSWSIHQKHTHTHTPPSPWYNT